MLQAKCKFPDITLDFKLTANGEPTYTVNYNKAVVESAMGIKLKENQLW
jgi:hypothetical protein